MRRVWLVVLGAALLASFNVWAGAGAEAETGTEAAVPAGKYNEAPMLAALVAAGELPPVDDRLPENPSVQKPLVEIGQYGGTARVFAIDINPWNDMTESVERGRYMLMAEGAKLVPDVAEAVEMAPDKMSMTIRLRRGHKWSDGAPLTADDIVFQFLDMHLNEEVVTYYAMTVSATKRVVKLDDYTART